MRYLIILLALACASACTPTRDASAAATTTPATTTPDAPSYAGEWDVTVSDTPAGTVRGTLVLSEGDDGLEGVFVVEDAETKLRSVSATDAGLKLSFYSSQYNTDVNMDLKGAPSEQNLIGTTLGSFRTTAVRKM
ncbi:hypothetical protein [Lewinella sp. IMCC34183]|uniref:hypothetical protein n=1 Tax=Lewinella sp. IMCC34183 TaxID=2248762 RepID=UPI000E24C3F9|nr:hypothetical protein [Lewinella sp. IMCC34183]